MTKLPISPERALALVARLRLVLAIAGAAWLLGYSPAVGGRIVVGLVVGLVLVLDAAAGANAEPKSGLAPGRKGGAA